MKIFNKYERSTIHIRPRLYLCVLNMKRLGCIVAIARISLRYKVILVLQPKLSLKTRFPAHCNTHVTSRVIHKIDE